MAKTRNIEAVRDSLVRKEVVSASTNLDHRIFVVQIEMLEVKQSTRKPLQYTMRTFEGF